VAEYVFFDPSSSEVSSADNSLESEKGEISVIRLIKEEKKTGYL
jgi:hypothetical protein